MIVVTVVCIDSRMKMMVFSAASAPILSPRVFSLGVLACFSLSAVLEMPLDLADTLCLEVAARPTPKPEISDRDKTRKHSASEPSLPISLEALVLSSRKSYRYRTKPQKRSEEEATLQTNLPHRDFLETMVRGLSQASSHGPLFVACMVVLFGTCVMGYMPSFSVPRASRLSSPLRPPSMSCLPGRWNKGTCATVGMTSGKPSSKQLPKLTSLRMADSDQPSVRTIVDLFRSAYKIQHPRPCFPLIRTNACVRYRVNIIRVISSPF